MIAMFYDKLLRVSFLALLTLIPSSYGCSCINENRNSPEFLCKYDYVLHGEVINETIIGSNASVENHERVYTVKVKKIFKGLDSIKNTSKDGHNNSYVELHTSYYGSACGIIFNVNLQTTYVIAGGISRNNQLRIASCDWIMEWRNTKNSFKEYFPKLKYCRGSSQVTAVKFMLSLPLLLTVYLL